jgi:hypothetical protein
MYPFNEVELEAFYVRAAGRKPKSFTVLVFQGIVDVITRTRRCSPASTARRSSSMHSCS